MVDRVIRFEPRAVIETIKNITFNEPILQGHFCGGPYVFPGVLLIEALAQSALLLSILSGDSKAGSSSVRLAEVKASFRGPVMAGDQLHMMVTMEPGVPGCHSCTGVGRVDGQSRVKATFISVDTGAR